jgi:CTP synthase (UTP-ammonia lyase)
MAGAAHAEYGAAPEEALITPAACAVPEPGFPRLKGKQRVRLSPGSLAARVYGTEETFSEFHCSNELNRRYQPLFDQSTLRVSGVGDEGEARVVELTGATFYVATLYLPQLAEAHGKPDPLIDAYVRAAAGISPLLDTGSGASGESVVRR